MLLSSPFCEWFLRFMRVIEFERYVYLCVYVSGNAEIKCFNISKFFHLIQKHLRICIIFGK